MKATCKRAAVLAAILLLGGPGAGAQEHDHGPSHDHLPLIGTFKVDQLENRWQDGRNSLKWEAQGWYGGDTERVWFNSEGEKPAGEGVEEAEFQLLYSRLWSEFWDVQAGIRHDIRPQPRTTYGVVGVKGVAPYFFEVTAQAFVSEEGGLSARLKVEYDLLITQKLILQPSLETNAAVQRVRELGVGSGLNDVALGLRLRYEIVKEFAPYVGINWERKLGGTASLARTHGEDPDVLSVLTGIRFWF
ncbi:copper resistance protein B [Niveispirillum sp.]|uniref:copper resistance protein B n=1 Tax=Niveispirillum sp. TaxID=1917217 RepID=UPI001B4E91D0|nr:copper resistance protein B [Niveispirillum sp.]MBP7336997.1 copper resistance protein B [Niveispirillum sp.]